MTTKKAVLSLLAAQPGKPLSGEVMAQSLNCSRTAIWKAVTSLREAGHLITSKQHVGYCYQPSDILSAEGIALLLPPDIDPLEILVADSLPSTNLKLKELALSDEAKPTLLLARQQTATRGRFQRPFFASDNEDGLYFSLLLYPEQQSADYVSQYTLLAAVAMARALEELTPKKIAIKWVNDLYLDGKKIAGILSEGIADLETQTVTAVVIGIGLNFAIPQEHFPTELQDRATSLFNGEQPTCTRNEIVAAFLRHFYVLLTTLETKEYLADYRNRSFVLGKEVSFQMNQQTYHGRATGIGPAGELLVTLPNQQILALSSGEISLKSIQMPSQD